MHAQLLAKDLDDETLLKYMDRYIMYYIRTADRMQRTARWIEELPGGVDHIYDVVVDDSLGIASDLEEAIQRHVDRYEDEWTATLNDPRSSAGSAASSTRRTRRTPTSSTSSRGSRSALPRRRRSRQPTRDRPGPAGTGDPRPLEWVRRAGG